MRVHLLSQRGWEAGCACIYLRSVAGKEDAELKGCFFFPFIYLAPVFKICCHEEYPSVFNSRPLRGQFRFFPGERGTARSRGQDIHLDQAVIERTLHADEGVLVLQADELLEYAEKGAITSEALSRIAESLDEDSNPVLMFLSFSGQ